MNFHSKKTKRTITLIIAIVMVLCLVIPLVVSVL